MSVLFLLYILVADLLAIHWLLELRAMRRSATRLRIEVLSVLVTALLWPVTLPMIAAWMAIDAHRNNSER